MLVVAGDEDRSTQSRRRPGLARATLAADRVDVTVDLTALSFADPTLMVDLAMLARRVRKAERAFVVRGAQPQIATLIELVGLHRLPGVVVDT